MVGGFIALFIIILLIFAFNSRLYITFRHVYNHDEEMIQVAVRLYHVQIYQKDVDPKYLSPFKDDSKNNIHFYQRIQRAPKYMNETLTHIQKTYRITRQQIQKVHVHQFKWITEVGTGCASTTGVVCGGIWGAKGILTGMLKNKLKLRLQPRIQVVPYYQHAVMASDLRCIVSLTIGNAIRVWFRIRHIASDKELLR